MSDPKLNWRIELTCRDCGFSWEYLDEEAGVSIEAFSVSYAFNDDAPRKVSGRIVMLKVPEACPMCRSLRVIG